MKLAGYLNTADYTFSYLSGAARSQQGIKQIADRAAQSFRKRKVTYTVATEMSRRHGPLEE